MLNTASVKSILTLRYDNTKKPFLPKLTAKDFQKKRKIQPGFIEKNIILYLKKQICEYDGPLSISLSGGIDSTLILGILSKHFPKNEIHATTIKFAESVDETEPASKIAKKLGAIHHIVEIKNYFKEFDKIISLTNSPFWDIHWYYAANNAKKYSKFLITGDGADELFAGYTFRYSKYLSLLKKNSDVSEKIKFYLECHERDHVPDQSRIFGEKIKFNWNQIKKNLLPFFDNSLSPLDQVFLADYNGKLSYNFSLINKIISNKLEINYISPFLSKELIFNSAMMFDYQKYDFKKNIGKLPLRNLLKKYGLNSFTSKEKFGFSVNPKNLWKNYGYDLCKKFLINGKTLEDNLINKKWVLENINKENLDIRYINKFYGLLALEIWYSKQKVR